MEFVALYGDQILDEQNDEMDSGGGQNSAGSVLAPGNVVASAAEVAAANLVVSAHDHSIASQLLESPGEGTMSSCCWVVYMRCQGKVVDMKLFDVGADATQAHDDWARRLAGQHGNVVRQGFGSFDQGWAFMSNLAAEKAGTSPADSPGPWVVGSTADKRARISTGNPPDHSHVHEVHSPNPVDPRPFRLLSQTRLPETL